MQKAWRAPVENLELIMNRKQTTQYSDKLDLVSKRGYNFHMKIHAYIDPLFDM